MPGTLFIVATPIGNLSDTTARAQVTLKNVSRIFCEDTRVTKKLTAKFNITTPLESYHQHSDASKIVRLAGLLAQGESVALVTDAGTPGISDPGNYLISELLFSLPDLKVVPIPGASAAIAALSVSGFPTEQFVFLGFPPVKKQRAGFFKELLERAETVVFYESPHRIMKALTALAEISTDREIMVARELTKLHETIYRGTIGAVLERLKPETPRGEYVVVVRGHK